MKAWLYLIIYVKYETETWENSAKWNENMLEYDIFGNLPNRK